MFMDIHRKKFPNCRQFSAMSFLLTVITIAFHVCWDYHYFSFLFIYLFLFSELFTLSKNSFDHPNTRP